MGRARNRQHTFPPSQRSEAHGQGAAEPQEKADSPVAEKAPTPVVPSANPPQPSAQTTTAQNGTPAKPRGVIGRFVSENTNVVSSFVIGIAGLSVTAIYQCNQGELQRRQAEAQMKIARQQADNSWRIERAKILSENLKTLTARGGDTVEQRYGVLLSLLRGSILEPDVAVSYALELGRDNPDYMRSVLANIDRRDEQHYQRLLTAYYPTCEQKYGISAPNVSQCNPDKWAERSSALASTFFDVLEDQNPLDGPNSPMCLLKDERQVQTAFLSLVGLFGPFLQDLYERRMWAQIEKFCAYSQGAKLVGTLALAISNNDSGTETEADKAFAHRLESQVQSYVDGSGCETECRVKVFAFLLTNLSKSHGMFERVLRAELEKPRAKIEPLLVRLATRLQFCQFDPGDAETIRDDILVPTLDREIQAPKPDNGKTEMFVAMLAELPEPSSPKPAWKKFLERLDKASQGRLGKLLLEKRTEVQKQRKLLLGPPKPGQIAKKRPNFCLAADEDAAGDDEEE